VIAGQINLNLTALGLGFLQTQDVRLVCLEKGLKLLLSQDSPDTVHIPGIDLHADCPCSRRGGNTPVNRLGELPVRTTDAGRTRRIDFIVCRALALAVRVRRDGTATVRTSLAKDKF
jgi:hypothetical protein